MGKPVSQALKRRTVVMAVLLAAVVFLTYYSRAILEWGADLNHFLYVPVILASFWWKRKGLFVALFLGAVLIAAYVFLEMDAEPITHSLFEAAMFVIVALVVATLSEKVGKRDKEARKDRRFSQNIIATVPESLLVLDKNLRIKSANRSFYQLFQTELEKTIGRKVADILGDADGKLSTALTGLFGTEDTLDNFELRYQSEKLGERIFNITARGIIVAEEEEEEEEEEELVVIRDITERKRTEAQIKELQEYLQLQVERMPIGLIVWNTEFRVRSWNPAAEKIFGFTANEARGKHPYDIIVPKDAQPYVDDIWRRLLEGDMTAHSENENTTKDGRTIICDWSNTPLKDNDGRVIGVLSMVQDITERKQAEEEIKHLSLTLRAIRNVNQLISRENDRSRLLQEICRLLTESRSFYYAWVALLDDSGKVAAHAEVGLGKDFEPLRERLNISEIPACGQKALGQVSVVTIKKPASICAGCPVSNEMNNNGALTVRLEHAGKVYGLLHASIPAAFINEEETSLFKEVADDVAFALHDIELEEENRLAVRALQDAEERYRDLYDNAPVPYFSVDATGIIRECNKTAHLWLGYPPREMIGKSRLEVYAEESKNKAKQLFEDFKRGATIEDEEMIFIRKDGQKVYGLLSMNAIKDKDGRIIANRGVVKDITERKQMEERLRALYEVEKRQREELEEEQKARSQFINVLSHELKTPLTPLLGCVSFLRDLWASQPESSEYRAANLALDGAEKLASRLNELLDLARFAIGAFTLKRESLDVKALLEEVASEFEPYLAQQKQSIVVDVPENLPATEGDRSRLEQVVTNLLSNASKFSPGVGRITVRVRDEANELIVEVQDQGTGLTVDEQTRLFKPYHRVEQDRQRFHGLGLGLAICKEIVEAHGGRIWVNSKPGMGSTFSFSIPAKVSKANEA